MWPIGVQGMDLLMSLKERERLKLVTQVQSGKLGQAEAAELLGLSVRQIRRLVRRYEQESDSGLVHRLRGCVSNHKSSPALRERCISLVRDCYADYGPTLASETLAGEHDLHISRETLRHWMMEAGLWKGRVQRVVQRQWRERKQCIGQMVQLDTSIHDWFEGRGEKCVLIALIDDASSRLFMRFHPTDSTQTNMMLLHEYVQRYGRPVAIYADRASHFTTTRCASVDEELEGSDAQTQIQRAFKELDIEYIKAYSPQAKGRVERLFKTLQDRLVKAMRRAGITNIEQANQFVEHEFMPMWNQRFAVEPACAVNAHRSRKGYDLNAIFSVQHKRTVTSDYTIQIKNERLQILKTSIKPGLRKARVIVEERLDGTQRVRWRNGYLRYVKIVTKQPSKKDACLLAPTVGLRPSSGANKQKPPKPGHNHPWKKAYKAGQF